MDSRLYGATGALWLLFVLLLTVLTAMSSHPTIHLTDFFPGKDPSTWIVPGLIVSPPCLVVAAINSSTRLSKIFGWSAFAIQAASSLLLVLMFAAIFIFG